MSGDESESANALAKVCFWPILDHSGANGFIEDEKDGGCGGQPSCRTDGQGQSYDSKAPYHGSSRKGSPNNPANAQPMLRLLHPHITLPTSYGRCFVFYMLARYRGEPFFSSFSFFFPGRNGYGVYLVIGREHHHLPLHLHHKSCCPSATFGRMRMRSLRAKGFMIKEDVIWRSRVNVSSDLCRTPSVPPGNANLGGTVDLQETLSLRSPRIHPRAR